MADETIKAQGGYDWMDRERFLKHYKLKIDCEFEIDGNAAEWAENGHRFWGREDDAIVLEKGDPDMREDWPSACAALSPDGRILAVATNAVIRLYDISSKTKMCELRGHDENVEKLYFSPQTVDSTHRFSPDRSYTLVSYGFRDPRDGRILIWRLHAYGNLINRNVASVLPALVGRTTRALMRDLKDQDGVSDEDLQSLRPDLREAVHQAVLEDQAKAELPVLHARLTSFGLANPISRDGKKLITLEKNNSTQSGMRPLEDMPRIVVRNIADLSEHWRLTGHQDAIMWAGWSPDDKHVAEASWDETFGIWSPEVKDRAEGHLIGPSGGQNWMGDFSADGKYILFSGGRPTKVAVYEVETGEEVAELKHPAIVKGTWVREMQWSPVDYTLAVIVEQNVVLWRPLEAGSPFDTVLKIGSDGSLLDGFNRLFFVKWVDDGRKVVVRDTANTIFLWDISSNRKWRFQRPEGLGLETNPDEVFFVKQIGKDGALLSLDGDGKVRYWYL